MTQIDVTIPDVMTAPAIPLIGSVPPSPAGPVESAEAMGLPEPGMSWML